MTMRPGNHDPKYAEPDSFGVPYFEATIVNGREHGTCPVCGLAVERAPGAFGAHWAFAVAVESTLRTLAEEGLIS